MGRQIAIELLILVAIGLALGVLGPFGTYDLPAALRLIYWVGFILVGYLFFRPINFIADWLAQATRIPWWLSITIAIVVATFPLTILISFAIGGMRFDENPMLQDYFGLLYLQVAGIGVAIFLLMHMLFGSQDKVEPTNSDPNVPADVGEAVKQPANLLLAKRLPGNFCFPIEALSVEDHYVRAFAADGTSEMLLMRFSDAISEMDGVDGIKVHRSWWVANGAVRRAVRDGRNMRLLLDSGLKVPVSRSNIMAIRKLGWL